MADMAGNEQVSWGDLSAYASKACRDLIRRTEEVAWSADLPEITEATERELSGLVYHSIQGALENEKQRDVVSVADWLMRLGEIVVFEALFNQWLDSECQLNLHKWKQTVLLGFEEIKSKGLIGEYQKAFDKAMNVQISAYSKSVNEIEKKFRKKEIDYDSALLLSDDFLWVDMVREEFEQIFDAARFLHMPPSMVEWMRKIRDLDAALTDCHRRYDAIQKTYFSPVNTGLGNLNTMIRRRFGTPPEHYPWAWTDVESEEGKPLPEVFRYDLEDIRRKLETID